MFVAQHREVDGFRLDNVPRAPAQPSNLKSDVAALIYHGSCRRIPLDAPVVALRLADVIDFRRALVRFSTRLALCAAFRIHPDSAIILTGVDHDARIEPWWALRGERIPIIRSLSKLGLALVTTPNFSLLLDNPRTDDLHAMKRIAITFSEFQKGGLSCALHPNGRTERDFERWGRFISDRSEVSTLAYEFITGAGRLSRRQFHLDQLSDIAKKAGRPLDIVVRGDPSVIPFLRECFREVIYIDTTAFVKTQKRRVAERAGNNALNWTRVLTDSSSPLDRILRTNVDEQRVFLRSKYFGDQGQRNRAA
ncbi:hypothetical protein [Parvibaculum sp.]|uniref:hypothetical protein n=1 Tax=Parvibaculum sp. TaxID=2024848 RepID=UPI00391A7A07